eukprot:TCONS_00025155-protein
MTSNSHCSDYCREVDYNQTSLIIIDELTIFKTKERKKNLLIWLCKQKYSIHLIIQLVCFVLYFFVKLLKRDRRHKFISRTWLATVIRVVSSILLQFEESQVS